MSPIKDINVSIENVDETLVKRYGDMSETQIYEVVQAFDMAIGELIQWGKVQPSLKARCKTTIAFLTSIQDFIFIQSNAKAKARLARLDEMEGCDHG